MEINQVGTEEIKLYLSTYMRKTFPEAYALSFLGGSGSDITSALRPRRPKLFPLAVAGAADQNISVLDEAGVEASLS